MIKDAYLSIADVSTGEYKDRGSKFIAYAYPVSNEMDIQNAQDALRKEHSKARHHCYAWRLGLDTNSFRANDDGEPSGTAGRPILGQIDAAGLTNVLVIVVRYFGGTLLGTSGLINAYREACADALAQARIVEHIVGDAILLDFDYSLMSDVMNALKKLHIEITQQSFDERAYIHINIRKSETAQTLLQLRAAILKVSLEEAQGVEQIAGLKIIFKS